MPWEWAPPDIFLEHEGVTIYHTYDDDVIRLINGRYYSTCESAPEDSIYEFGVEDLPGYDSKRDRDPGLGDPNWEYHKELIEAAIDAGLLRQDEPLDEEAE